MEWNKKTWMSLIIAVLMIASVIGFALEFRQPTQALEFNGYTFVQNQYGFQTKVNNVRLTFYYYPRDIESIPFDEGAKVALDGAKVLWFTYDPNDFDAVAIADALYYMEQALGTAADIYVQRGLLNSTGYSLPEVSCANATVAVPVLVLQSGNETKVEHSAGCVTATASDTQAVYQLGDRLLYQQLKVMQ